MSERPRESSRAVVFEQQNYYQRLGVRPDATPDEISVAFRRVSKIHHPEAGGDAEIMKLVTEAHATLKDPEKKAQYDRMLRSSSPQETPRHHSHDQRFWDDVRAQSAAWNAMSPEERRAQQEQEVRETRERMQRQAEEAARREQERQAQEKMRFISMETWCQNVLNINIEIDQNDSLNTRLYQEILSEIYNGSLAFELPRDIHSRSTPRSINIFANAIVRKSPIPAVVLEKQKEGRRIIYVPNLHDVNRLREQLRELIEPTLESDFTLLERSNTIISLTKKVEDAYGYYVQLPSFGAVNEIYNIIEVLAEIAHERSITPEYILKKFGFVIIRFDLNYGYGTKSENKVERDSIIVSHDTWKDRSKLKVFINSVL